MPKIYTKMDTIYKYSKSIGITEVIKRKITRMAKREKISEPEVIRRAINEYYDIHHKKSDVGRPPDSDYN